jgi:hypothetical protein
MKHSPSGHIDRKVVSHQWSLDIGPPGTADGRPQPSQQLLSAEWFREAVICTGVEHGDGIHFATQLRHHENGHIRPSPRYFDDLGRVRFAGVKQNGTRPTSPDQRDGLLNSACLCHFVPAIAKGGRLNPSRL